MDKEIFIKLYKSLVRPHLEYGSQAWSVIYKKECMLIENVQRRATTIVKNISNKNIHTEAESPGTSLTTIPKSKGRHGGNIQNNK